MKAKVIISAFAGTLFALITYFLLRAFKISDALALCVISGSLFFIMLYVFLLANEKRMHKKYAEFEADNLHFYIVTKDEELYVLTIPDTETVIGCLQEKGWPDR